jgi:hypothetical protein
MKISKKLSLLFAVGLLLAPLGLQFAARRVDAEKVALPGGKALAGILPRTLAGFDAHDEPIAATDEMKRAVGELLNFSDAAYRIYQAPGRRMSVYVAWWEAGRMSPRLVAAHTPDVCWPVVGWTRSPERERNLYRLGVALAQEAFAPAEMRVFVTSEKPEYVVFWHRVGSDPQLQDRRSASVVGMVGRAVARWVGREEEPIVCADQQRCAVGNVVA